MTVKKKTFVLSEGAKQTIDVWVRKYPKGRQRSAVVEALFVAQEENDGWLSPEAVEVVADYLQLPVVMVFEVATFYDMFNLAPIGRHKISVCTNVSCQLKGSDEIVACLKSRLGIGLGETTEDGLFTLREVECMAACAGAPMCQIDDKQYHEHLTQEKMLALIDKIESKESAPDAE